MTSYIYEKVKGLNVKVETKPINEVYAETIRNWPVISKGRPMPKDMKGIAHSMVNYIRHNLTDYEALLLTYNRSPDLYKLIKEKTLVQIKKAYPMLAVAANEQLAII